MPQSLAKLGAQLLSFLFILSSEQYCEFIAAHTADQTVGRQHFYQHITNVLQDLIAGDMTIPVVDLLEIIQIHHD